MEMLRTRKSFHSFFSVTFREKSMQSVKMIPLPRLFSKNDEKGTDLRIDIFITSLHNYNIFSVVPLNYSYWKKISLKPEVVVMAVVCTGFCCLVRIGVFPLNWIAYRPVFPFCFFLPLLLLLSLFRNSPVYFSGSVRQCESAACITVCVHSSKRVLVCVCE